MSEIKSKLITAFKKSVDLINIDNLSDFYVCGNEIQLKMKGLYFRIYLEKINNNRDVFGIRYKITFGHLSETLTDDEFHELFLLANEKYQKFKIERQDNLKKISEKELDDFLRLY